MGLGKWSALNESLPAGRIFISYRRQETAWPAGRLYDVLVEHFPAEQVFKDVENIEPGEDFVERITAAVGSCDVLLALIGPHWLTITDENSQRRLDDPEDYVRIEIEAALKRKIRVIPILVDEAPMPGANQLPASLAALVRRNAVEINPLTFDTEPADGHGAQNARGGAGPAPRRGRAPASRRGSRTTGPAGSRGARQAKGGGTVDSCFAEPAWGAGRVARLERGRPGESAVGSARRGSGGRGGLGGASGWEPGQ